MNAWKIACATLVIFLAGIITGATLVRFAYAGPRWRVQRPLENRPPGNPSNAGNPGNPNQEPRPNPNPAGGLLSREFVQILERQLQLTPEQRQQIGTIMAEGQERVRELRARIDPEVRKEMQQTREQIRAVLTPEQREQFEQLMKRTQRRNDRGEAPGPPDRRFRGPPDPPSGDARPGEPPPPPHDR